MTRKSRLEVAAKAILEELVRDGLPIAYEEQFRFHPVRLWKSDFRVWDASRSCLVEIEGVTSYGKVIGRHQSAKGFAGDAEKYNAAVLLGWTLFRFTEGMMAEGQMDSVLREFFVEEAAVLEL